VEALSVKLNHPQLKVVSRVLKVRTFDVKVQTTFLKMEQPNLKVELPNLKVRPDRFHPRIGPKIRSHPG